MFADLAAEEPGPLLAQRNHMRFEGILEGFSGKARDTIVNFTIPALVESDLLGFWKKGVSRTVHATLNKQNVAAKWARDVRKALFVDYSHPFYNGLTDMIYGSFGAAPKLLTEEALGKLHAETYLFTPKKKGAAAQNVGETIERWARANAEVAELVALLDSRRPKPTVVMKTLSPTVAQNVSARIGLDVSTIQSPPMHGEWVEVTRKGQTMKVWQVVIDWPEGTKHCKSRFLGSDAGNQQCEACGHAIQDAYNWVPILSYDAGKTPYSLWTGKDCARKLFGCEIEGDALYKREGA